MTTVPTDPLSDVLRLVRMSGELLCLGRYAAPWSLSFDGPDAQLHVLQRGHAWLVTPGASPIALHTGDTVILPRGAGHILTSDPALQSVPIAQSRMAAASEGIFHRLEGPGARSDMICGRFSFDGVLVPRLLTALPEVIHVRGRAAQDGDGLQVTIRFLVAEAQDPTPGAAVMINRLLDLLFIQVVRDWGSRNPNTRGWLAGLRDAQIGRALSAIHRDPAKNWTVALLSQAAGLSRSAFARRFADAVGQTPMKYVATWRLDRAADHLRSGTARIARIAALTGYSSEAALSRAFKQHFGQSPATFRNRRGTSPAD